MPWLNKFWQLPAKALVWGLAHSPQWVRDVLGQFFGFLWFDVFRLRRKVALDNLQIAFPQWTGAQRRKCARRSVQAMLATIFDYSLMAYLDRAQAERIFEIQGFEHWQAARSQGRGVLLLSLHLGKGDLGVAALSCQGWPLYLISKEFRSPTLNKIWFGLRRRHGTRFISFHKSLFEILRALRENAAVIFVLDQYMGPPSGVPTHFFGAPTGTAKGLAMIAERTGAPVLPIYTHAIGGGRHRIVIEPEIIFQERNDKDETIRFMTQLYTDKIQEIITKFPDEWMWVHKRWKSFA